MTSEGFAGKLCSKLLVPVPQRQNTDWMKSDNSTLESIGRACGVSHITVSRALRGLGNVKPDTARRIREYAESVGYKVNPIARTLARGRNGDYHLTATKSIILPYKNDNISTRSALFWDYVEGAVKAAGERQSSIEVMGFSGSGSSSEFDFIRALVEDAKVAGVLNFGLTKPTADYLLSKNIPMVARLQSVHQMDNRKMAVVYPDHIQGYLLAWKYLQEMGHTHFGYLLREDHESHLQECVAASHLIQGVPRIDKTFRFPFEITDKEIYPALSAEWGSWKKGAWPSVLFCSNDDLAQQVVVSLTRANIRVPDQVSIVGFDDSHASLYCNPPITTVRNPRLQVGMSMLHLLKDIIAGRPNSRCRVEVLPMELVERQSVMRIST